MGEEITVTALFPGQIFTVDHTGTRHGSRWYGGSNRPTSARQAAYSAGASAPSPSNFMFL